MAPIEGDSKRDENSGDKEQPDFEKVVDELRNVLAGLNSPKTEPGRTVPPIELLPPEDAFLRSPSPLMSPEEEPEKLGEAVFRQAAGLDSTPPSDQEFWNGNVLGWPVEGAVSPEEPKEELKNGMVSPEIPVAKEEISSADFPVMPPPSVGDRLWLEGHMDEDLPQVFSAPPPEPKPVKLPPLRFNAPDEFVLPPAPTPPSDLSEETFPASDKNTDFILEPINFKPNAPLAPPPILVEDSSDLVQPPKSEAGEKAPEPSRTVLPANLKIPIPGTLHQLPSEKKKNLSDPTLAEMDIYHNPVFSIACLFPEGKTAEAEEFVKRLKAAMAIDSRMRALETVMMNPWTAAQIDPHAWKKAASLSGANFMFVLSSRRDKDLFKDVQRVTHKDEIRARVVFLEQIAMRQLYADLLADTMRGSDVKS